MHVIWKRPDGFHAASPADYYVIEVGENAKLWLHRKDTENFPFRISGGWQDEQGSVKLNQLVNLLHKETTVWGRYLKKLFAHSESSDAGTFLGELTVWLDELASKAKGDTWEREIIQATLMDIKSKIQSMALDILK